MALLQGTGGTTGRRSRVDQPRSPMPGAEPADVREDRSDTDRLRAARDLRVDHGPRIGPAGPEDAGPPDPPGGGRGAGLNAAAIEATLLRLAASGPTLTEVLDVLVHEAAALLEAPARVAVVVDGRLVWTAGAGDPGPPIGADVNADGTACGEAWRTGLIQNVTRPTEAGADQAIRLSTACCDQAAVVLAVPLLREGSVIPGRHAGFTREVFAVLALTGRRPGWFDDNDIEAGADLAEVAGERTATLTLIAAEPAGDPEPSEQASSEQASPEPEPLEPVPVLADSLFVPTVDPVGVPQGRRRRRDGRPVPAPIRPVGVLFSPPAADAAADPTAPVAAVPAARSGRSGFAGWFSRSSKPSKNQGIPAPRPGLDAPEQLRVEAVRPARVRTLSVRTVRTSSVPDSGVSESMQSGPISVESFSAEPVSTASVSTASASVEPIPDPRTEPTPEPASDSAPGPAPSQPEPVPSLPEPGSGFGPASRLTRARIRPTVGTPMPPAMPAPDSMGLWQWDAVSGECTWSSPVARLLGLAPDSVLDLSLVRAAVAPADRGRFDVAVRAIGTGRGVAGALRLKTPDGRAQHAYAWSEVRRDEAGKLLGAWGGVVDVTAFEHDAAALRSGLAGLRAAQELTGLATWQWQADAGRLIWSDEMYRLAGVPAETFDPTPERWHAFVHPDDLERARRLDLDADLAAGPGQDGERVETFRLIGPGGEIRHVQSWSATTGDRVVYGATIDVTRQVHDRMTLERLSATDPVTGLGNRLAFDRRMQQLLAGTTRATGSVTLLLLDLDRFKVVNDSLGHQVGDRLLIEVARRLVAVVPIGSVTARMGGDEFVVVPPAGAAEPEVRRLASGIVEALRAPYVLPETGELLVCPASLGVAMSQGRQVTGHDLLREADIALYRAKDAGRDRFVVFDEALKVRTQTRQRAERRLRTALEEDRLMMQYQPVVDFSNGRVIGAEGLVRLRDLEDSPEAVDRLIVPELFLDIAEQTGLVVEIDCWVIETAIEQLADWAGPGDPGPWLAINLSARSMEHPRVIRRLIEAVKRGEVDRDRIKIELTEQSFIGSLPGVETGVRQLISHGIGVGIDDFGTGYSALAYLQHFDLDFMKIDRSFVSSVGEGPRGDAVVTAIVDLAHAHGMRVIAEGVESGRQARRLREIGCDFAQGFHFGRPGEADRIVRG